MKQVAQNYSSGELRLEEVPVPVCKAGSVLVRASYSLVSTGTELMKVAQARMSLMAKARARPDKVRQVINNVRQKGLVETYRLVHERLNALTPIGYSLAGVVEEVGRDVDEFAVGDRVACGGEGVACHGEFVSVPRNLCVRVPEGVDLADAAYTTCGAIAMQGVRQGELRLGETVVVIGLGLIGLLGVQILKAAGCRVIAIDVDPARVPLAKACGAEIAMTRHDPALPDAIAEFTGGFGADAAYIAASAKSSDPMEFAAEVLRDRGKVIIVGMVNIEADWRACYGKELSIVLSRSYGPGRYDRNYEQKGIDYPVGYVRWTEGRNMEEFLRLLQSGSVQPSLLGQKIFPFDQAAEVYDQLHAAPNAHPIGILFKYPAADSPGTADRTQRKVLLRDGSAGHAGNGSTTGIGMIGAGNFATGTLIPALKHTPNVRLLGICSAGGLSAKSVASRHGFDYCASDYQALLSDPNIHAVVVATRHDTHAQITVEALDAGKHVFVEKPLALTAEQLGQIVDAQARSGRVVMAGFNRRHSPLSIAARDFFAGRSSPIEVVCRVNAGPLKADSWYKDADEGGWRILSEGCHFIDLIQFLCGCPVERVSGAIIRGDIPGRQNDNCMVTLHMQDGSLGSLIYVANGDPSFEKERIEVFGQGRTAVIENWRCVRLSAAGKVRTLGAKGTGKGHEQELAAFARAIGAAAPDGAFQDAVSTTLASLAVVESIATGRPVAVAQCAQQPASGGPGQ